MSTNDDYKTTEPDEDRWHRSVQCQKVGCSNPVTFDFEIYCSSCIREAEARAKQFMEELAAYGSEIGVRR